MTVSMMRSSSPDYAGSLNATANTDSWLQS
jgi:hypothetical protein